MGGLKVLLQQHGFNPAKAELWANFVTQVLLIYSAAADELQKPTRWENFKNKKGAQGAPKKKKKQLVSVPVEDAITSEIGFLADELFCKLDADHFLRRHSTQLRFEALVQSPLRAGRHSKKIDFEVFSAFEDAPRLAIEAKPLTSLSDVGGRYLGDEGIGCFFSQDSSYATGPMGAMLAYTINETNTSMQVQVVEGLKNYKPEPLSTCDISNGSDGTVHCTYHDRASSGFVPITILHLERIFPLEILGAVDEAHVSTIAPLPAKKNIRKGK